MSNAKRHLQQMESNLRTREHLFAESVREVDERHHCANVVLAELLSAADADVCRTMPNTMVVSTSNATYAIKSASGVVFCASLICRELPRDVQKHLLGAFLLGHVRARGCFPLMPLIGGQTRARWAASNTAPWSGSSPCL